MHEKSKPCTRCGEMLPLTEFSPCPHGRYGRYSRCKRCQALMTRIRRAKGDGGRERLEGTVISAVDSMTARQMIWKSVKLKQRVGLFIDARMGAEVLRVYALRPTDLDAGAFLRGEPVRQRRGRGVAVFRPQHHLLPQHRGSVDRRARQDPCDGATAAP